MTLFQIHSLLPAVCYLCGGDAQPLKTDGSNITLCLPCEADLPWIKSQCRGCGLPLPLEADLLHCGECLRSPSLFQTVITPFYYRKPLDTLITGFKYRQGLVQGKLLGQLLAEEIRDHYCHESESNLPEVILPVPLHWQRFLWRGYNQSAELGQHLSRELEIPCFDRIVKRIRKTPHQQGLRREQRLHNVRHAFAITTALGHSRIPFKRVALLDDVVTTGTTVSEISRLLLARGVEEVHLWAIARTPA